MSGVYDQWTATIRTWAAFDPSTKAYQIGVRGAPYVAPTPMDDLAFERKAAEYWLRDPWLPGPARENLRLLILDIDRMLGQLAAGPAPGPKATGATCMKCNMHNEYAEASAAYVCYECRR